MTDHLAYLRAPNVEVFRNHHDSWSFLVQVTTKDRVAALQLEMATLDD